MSEQQAHPFANPAAGLPAGGPFSAAGGPFSIDLDVFEGPFDLLVTLILNEEVDLLEVHLAEIVLAYIERLEARGELDLEAATEFLILIAALLELKSRLMLPGEEPEGLDLEPQEAVEELLARLLDYRRFRAAADFLHEQLASEQAYRYRSASLPPATMPAGRPCWPSHCGPTGRCWPLFWPGACCRAAGTPPAGGTGCWGTRCGPLGCPPG